MHPYINIGSQLKIPLYNLLIAIGIIVGALFLEKEIKKYGIDFDTERKIFIFLIISFFCGVIGAKLYNFLLFNYSHQKLPLFFKYGVSFYGGLILGGFVFVLLIYFFCKNSVNFFINLIVPSLIIAHAFGRIGCFLAGCCYGKPTKSFLGMKFPPGSMPFIQYGNVKIHPVQLYSALFLFLLFVIIVKYVKFEYRVSAYFIGYGGFRFLIEFLRGDPRIFLISNKISLSQFISLIFFVTGWILILIKKLKGR